MNEKILKKLSLLYVKILQQEKLLKYYIDNGWEYHEDIIITRNRLYCYRYDVEQYKKQLKKMSEMKFNN